jgi:hypothetical protein
VCTGHVYFCRCSVGCLSGALPTMAVDGSDTDSSKSSAADALQASTMRVLEELKLGQKSQAADAGMLKDEFARVALSCKHSAETAQGGILALTALRGSRKLPASHVH